MNAATAKSQNPMGDPGQGEWTEAQLAPTLDPKIRTGLIRWLHSFLEENINEGVSSSRYQGWSAHKPNAPGLNLIKRYLGNDGEISWNEILSRVSKIDLPPLPEGENLPSAASLQKKRGVPDSQCLEYVERFKLHCKEQRIDPVRPEYEKWRAQQKPRAPCTDTLILRLIKGGDTERGWRELMKETTPNKGV